jgi:hypothetical protein
MFHPEEIETEGIDSDFNCNNLYAKGFQPDLERQPVFSIQGLNRD